MALSGVEIFKHLPKTNCKKCGHPTCLAFAHEACRQAGKPRWPVPTRRRTQKDPWRVCCTADPRHNPWVGRQGREGGR